MRAATTRDLPMRKFAGAAAVLVLHVVIVAVFLRATLAPRISLAPARESILILSALPKSPPKAKVKHPARAAAATFHYPDYSKIVLPPLPENSAATAGGLHESLFDCRVDTIANLTQEQRARCADASGGIKSNDSLDFADHTNRSRDAAHWARGRARKNGPLLLPCASPQSIYATASLATLLCAGDALVNGLGPDDLPGYADQPEETHIPNGGDPPPVYRDVDH